MKKKALIIVGLALGLIAGGAFGAFAGDGLVVEGKALRGTAYIQGHGGHVAVLDLDTGELSRIQHGKPSDALNLSPDNKTLYMFSLDGNSAEVDLATGKVTPWKKLGLKHCGSENAPDGTVWVSDMKDGAIYIYDPKTKKLADRIEVSKSVCGIDFSKDGKLAYASDMPGGFVSIIDVAKKKVIGKITGVGEFIHRARLTPDGTELWQSNGRELKDGKGFFSLDEPETFGNVVVIDTKTNKVKEVVKIGGNPHDVAFSPDGKYALVGSRQIPVREDSSLVVVDTETKQIVRTYSLCLPCHAKYGIEVPLDKDNGRAFLCAVDVAWK
jgi:WD40 repeat protein